MDIRNMLANMSRGVYKGTVLPPDKCYGFDAFLDRLVDSPVLQMRLEAARLGYGLDILINDPSPLVRKEVAKHDYRPDIMVNDPSPLVRREIAKHGYADVLIDDSSPIVRATARKYYRESDKAAPIENHNTSSTDANCINH